MIHFYLLSSSSLNISASSKQINIYCTFSNELAGSLIAYVLLFTFFYMLNFEDLTSMNHFIKTHMKNLIMLCLLF